MVQVAVDQFLDFRHRLYGEQRHVSARRVGVKDRMNRDLSHKHRRDRERERDKVYGTLTYRHFKKEGHSRDGEKKREKEN
eukprot:CAMPEP_0197301596 /NCGR_PEP_ID=MMETSP0890-20130614/50502_1 /TAXON_ID=44058 ORGANISM="Aureoumbra lagunensis, Strain CCMP1510" /NCGR_SAMPLE_ID=MMETSP0890 /ASSEMBLY_ACC=CAM_ASM_000533 /LENGTH=79 /DNA_ID=CAMNT_0042780941 /DNA_START=364 /DNA_END=603 /DNA_ORIENTATION=+